MAKVKLIDGRIIEGVKLTNVRRVGDEGGQSATAHIDGHTYDVYKNDVDGFTDIWNEQMSWETYKKLQGAGDQFIEGND